MEELLTYWPMPWLGSYWGVDAFALCPVRLFTSFLLASKALGMPMGAHCVVPRFVRAAGLPPGIDSHRAPLSSRAVLVAYTLAVNRA